jgi:hypothetical protein
MTLRSRCPHCQHAEPIAAGTNTQAALACRSCGQTYVPHRHLFVGSGDAPPEPLTRPAKVTGVAAPLPAASAPHANARWGFAALVLALMLMTQIALAKRDLWSAQWPITRAPLQVLCGLFGCEVKAPELLSAIALVSSGFDQQDDGSFVLSLHMKHGLSHDVATPAIELTLNDDFDRPVVRKVLWPAQVGLPARLPPGEGASMDSRFELDSELQPHVSGFRIELFYP